MIQTVPKAATKNPIECLKDMMGKVKGQRVAMKKLFCGPRRWTVKVQRVSKGAMKYLLEGLGERVPEVATK